MNIEREWKRTKTKWPDGFDLDDLIEDFLRRRVDADSPISRNRDDIVDFCDAAKSLDQAIARACDSLRPDGRMHNHQSRVPWNARNRLAAVLSTQRYKEEMQYSCQTFEELLELIERIGDAIPGIGPVTAYDVATRINGYLMHPQERLHLHAGCLAGAKALGLDTRGKESLAPGDLPEVLTGLLDLDEVEDFLCVYRNVLGKV